MKAHVSSPVVDFVFEPHLRVTIAPPAIGMLTLQ
jgi:hypothetical protein